MYYIEVHSGKDEAYPWNTHDAYVNRGRAMRVAMLLALDHGGQNVRIALDGQDGRTIAEIVNSVEAREKLGFQNPLDRKDGKP